MCVLLMIDFYALRSEQFSFLIRMFEEWEVSAFSACDFFYFVSAIDGVHLQEQ